MNEKITPVRTQAEIREDFHNRFLKIWPADSWLGVTVIVAVSGGSDSTALLLAMNRIRELSKAEHPTNPNGRLIVAHVNHKLRGKNSDGDESFVKELCEKLNVPFHCSRSKSGCSESGEGVTGLETVCRQQRYAFFEELAREQGARFVATGHHQADQIETLLFRAFRGTSVSGLAGIPRYRELVSGITLARPLLSFSRQEINSYVEANDQDFRTDESNLDSMFSRNWIRNELLPIARERFGSTVDRSLQRLADSANEQTELLNQLIDEWLASSTRVDSGSNLEIFADQWRQKSEAMIRYALVRIWKQQGWPQQSMTASHWHRLAKMILNAQPERECLPDGIEVNWFSNSQLQFRRT